MRTLASKTILRGIDWAPSSLLAVFGKFLFVGLILGWVLMFGCVLELPLLLGFLPRPPVSSSSRRT